MQKVFLSTSENYRLDRVTQSLEQIFEQMGGIENFIKPGMKVAIKPNLLSAKKPEDAATTHPSLVRAVTEMVQKCGGLVKIVESPGGPYNANSLKRVYTATGIEEVANETGAELNYDLRVEKIENTRGKIVKSLKILKPLIDADFIINIAKLKTHGIMVFTGAVKNMFGAVAGMEKADFHLRMDDYERFADSIIDIYLASKPKINIIDGITAMEGEGPGAGVPKYLGVILASQDAFACDYVASQIIGVDYKFIPILKMAEERELFNKDQVEIVGIDMNTVKPDYFDVPALEHLKPLESNKFLRYFKRKLRPQPEINHNKCVLCGKCIEVCPPKAISKDQDNKITINYKKCISCLCCHEFCHEKAVKIRKNTIRRIFEYKRELNRNDQ